MTSRLLGQSILSGLPEENFEIYLSWNASNGHSRCLSMKLELAKAKPKAFESRTTALETSFFAHLGWKFADFDWGCHNPAHPITNPHPLPLPPQAFAYVMLLELFYSENKSKNS